MSGVLVDPLVPLRAAVDTSVVTDPADLGDVALSDELVSVRAEIDRLEAQFARLVYAGHQRGISQVDGSPSTAAWLRRRTGMREGDARAAIEAGEVCEVLPATATAWRDGEITGGAARTIIGARVKGHDAKLRAVEPSSRWPVTVPPASCNRPAVTSATARRPMAPNLGTTTA